MKYILILVAITGFTFIGHLKLNKEDSSLKIVGTSSLHDWEMIVDEYDAIGLVTESQIKNLKVTVNAKSMKSGKSIMDNKAYDAVRADDYPSILFSAESLQLDGGKIRGMGTLEIAGKSREIDFSADIISDANGTMQLRGEVPLKMTDFDITPPTAMFGTLKTGDGVVIHYDIFITK
ncbi:YceI family protein [Ekhidna sp.]|uniref:YceI family protein n=1 Tax=Ekhidna sp. TaxID=2608089 RepID=UPI0032986A0A